MQTGRLYVVATPIGNLEDFSPRARRVLEEVSLIAAEDTRHSRRLLDHFNIKTPLTSYHDHNECEKTESLLGDLKLGKDIALISDAGTPCIADPGYRIVHAAREIGVEVIAIPGPSALIAALSVSGLPIDRFAFHGFFPRKTKDAVALLEHFRLLGGTHACYESPHRLSDSLTLIARELPKSEVCVARELTKIHEEVVRGSAAEVLDHFKQHDARGECVVLVHPGAQETECVTDEAILDAVATAVTADGLSRRDAIKHVAKTLRVPRNRVYDLAGEV